jgi:dipeptidyl aminopeptidase/acylaminoacyl peptidase
LRIVLAWILVGAGCVARAGSLSGASTAPVTIDDLIRQVQIPLAALSPSGRFAGYLLVSGDPLQNNYQLTLRVADTQRKSNAVTLAEYRLSPAETFDDMHWLLRTAAGLKWVGDEQLLYSAKVGGQIELRLWSAGENKSRRIARHDLIEIETAADPHDCAKIVTSDQVVPDPAEHVPEDRSWRMLDGYTFDSRFKNPKTGRRLRRQTWMVCATPKISLGVTGAPREDWESQPAEWKMSPASTDSDSYAWRFDETSSPDGSAVARIEYMYSHLRQPDESYSSFRIILKEQEHERVLVPETRPFVYSMTRILGWSSDGKAILYLYVSPASTSLRRISLDGSAEEIWKGPDLLSKPCRIPDRCQLLSRDARSALLVRSSNLMPAELVKVDLRSGSIVAVAEPNERFARAAKPSVEFYEIEGQGADAWGRLYLPQGYRRGERCPLVITQYAASPGFGTAIGDEVPIIPLTAHGIAVFDMYSGGFNSISNSGNPQAELARIRRPLQAMKSITEKLAADGLVDPTKIGVTGLSYGAEIAMYAYWNWGGLRAVSAATSSWDPSLYFLSGTAYARFLQQRGLPAPDGEGLRIWRMIAPGMNARADLPPLLFQSPDQEQVATAATWTQLRRAGAPVEWYEYPDEGHVKTSPANKYWVFRRNLDWFRFWLKDEVDHDPSKREQFSRWRDMRQQ